MELGNLDVKILTESTTNAPSTCTKEQRRDQKEVHNICDDR